MEKSKNDYNEYVKKIKNIFSIEAVKELFDKTKNIKVLLIGDTIIDQYIFTIPKGRAIKDPILSLDFVRSEKYPGGILAIANNISDFVDKLTVVTLLGDYKREDEFVRNNLNKNIDTKFFTKKDSPTTNKKRYIDQVREGKLFKVEFINDKPIDKELENGIVAFLKKELPKYDLVLLGDFGHGFINPGIIKVLEEHSKYLSANIQTNSSNMGFNYLTRYSKLDYLTSNETEVRLALTNRFGDLMGLIRELKKKTNFRNILLTEGKDGCLYIKNDNNYFAPALAKSIVDVVGAGDAVFSITSLFSYLDVDDELVPFIANCVGAIAVNIMGNKESVTKEKLIRFIEGVYNGVE